MSVLPPLDTSTICLASAAFYGIYSTHCSFQRPNPDVSNPTDVEKWNSALSDAISLLLQYSMPLLGLFPRPHHTLPAQTSSTVLVCWFTLHASLTRLDGVLGCFLPQNTRLKNWAEVLALGHCAFWALFLGYVIPLRVKDEEVMLKREFDGEWERWSGRTKRFIPGV